MSPEPKSSDDKDRNRNKDRDDDKDKEQDWENDEDRDEPAEKPNTFVVQGRVRSSAGNPVSRKIVRAYGKNKSGERLLGKGSTNPEGFYIIKYIAVEKELDLVIRAYDGERLLGESPATRQAKPRTTIDFQVGDVINVPTPHYSVHGEVKQEHGEPAENVTVRAFNKGLKGNDILLDEDQTNEAGLYEILYPIPGPIGIGLPIVNLWVQIVDQKGQKIVESTVVYRAGPEQVIDLTIPSLKSEYARLVATIQPLVGETELADLSPEDVQHLSQITSIDEANINRLVQSEKSARITKLSSAAFFGLYRKELPTTPNGLLTQNPETLRGAFDQAIAQNIIKTEDLRESVDDFMNRLPPATADATVENPETSPLGSIIELMKDVKFDDVQKKKFLALQLSHKGTLAEFWDKVAGYQEFSDKDQVRDLRFTTEVHTLTRGHLSLVRALRANFKQPTTTEALAAWTTDRWAGFMKLKLESGEINLPDNLPGENLEEKIGRYARFLAGQVELTYPTSVIRNRIQADDFEGAGVIKKFLDENPAISFGHNIKTLERALEKAKRPEGTAPDEVKALFISMERLYRIMPNTERYDFMQPLLNKGITSAQAIVRLGKGPFFRLINKTIQNLPKWIQAERVQGAKHVYTQALRVSAMAQQLYGKYAQSFNSVEFRVLSAPKPPSEHDANENPSASAILRTTKSTSTRTMANSQLAGEGTSATWERLFGAADYCQCEHCNSVYSPAAYLMDLLWFMETLEGSAKKELFRRRPDIEQLVLNCHNTDTEIPYIDLIIEVLESAVANGPDYEYFYHFIVNHVYQLVLGRVAESTEVLIFHSKNLRESGYQMLVRDFYNGVEYREKHPDRNPDTDDLNDDNWVFKELVQFTYKSLLERDPIADEISHHQNRWESEPVVQQRLINLWMEVALMVDPSKGNPIRDLIIYPGNTERNAEDLQAYPEYLNAKAYKLLCQAIYPFDLPFDLWIEESRRYFDHLGVKRFQLLELFRKLPPKEEDQGAQRQSWIAAEYLNLTERERDIITNEGLADEQISQFWGVNEYDEGWIVQLSQDPREFLRRAGLTFDEFNQLKDLQFIKPLGGGNDEGKLRLEPDPSENCSLGNVRVVGLDNAVLSGIHRFERLRRKLGWSMMELDQAIHALNSDAINDGLIRKLASLKWLRNELKLTVPELLTFWTLKFDNHDYSLNKEKPGYRSLYETLFLSEALLSKKELALAPFSLNKDNADRDELADPSKDIVEYRSRIQSALSITAEDLDLLVQYVSENNLWPNPDNDGKLNLENLTLLYRNITLSKALQLSIQDYLALRELTGINPFDAAF